MHFQDTDYHPVSATSVWSFLLAFISPLGFVSASWVIVAVASLILGVAGLRTVRRYELRGRNFAVIAMCLSVPTCLLAPCWHYSRYHSESLPGYTRLLLETKSPEKLDRFDGQPVCFKGYAIFTGRDLLQKSVVLSPNGDRRKIDTAITVEFDQGWNYQSGAIAASGTLKVNRDEKEPRKRYTLNAIKIVPVTNYYQLTYWSRVSEGC